MNRIKEKHDIYILEDAACSIGAAYGGTPVGNLADISVFSFHPRKFITTGEGGMITTNNTCWAEWMNSYKHFGTRLKTSRENSDFERIGTNYKLSNLLSAVGLVQMRHVDELLDRRIELAAQYIHLFGDAKGVQIPKTTNLGKHSRQSFCVHVENRDKVMRLMRETGIEVQIGSYALHMHPAFDPGQRCRICGDMEGSRYAFEHCLTLPLYHEMTDEEQQIVVNSLFQVLESS